MIPTRNKPHQIERTKSKCKRLLPLSLGLSTSPPLLIVPLLIAVILLLPINVLAEEINHTFEIRQVEGGQNKSRYTTALTQWLNKRKCNVSVTSSKWKTSVSAPNNPEAALLFTLLQKKHNASPTPTPGYNIIAKGLIVDNAPLTLRWLSHKKQKLSNLRSLDEERLALLDLGSPIGHDLALALLKDAGVKVDPNKLYFNTSYQGSVGLLLHRNVRAAAVVGPLAERWQESNDLQSLVEAPAEFITVILAKNTIASHTRSQCTRAFSQLKRESRRDSRMKLFPEWVDGFISIDD